MSTRKFDVDEKKATHIYSPYDVVKCITEFLEEALPQVGKKLNMKLSNIRLFVMFVACAAALYGQFGAKFPNDKLALAACVLIYFALSGVVTLLDYTALKKTSFIVNDKDGDVHVGVRMDKGHSHACMSFRRGAQAQEFKVDIEKLFDVEGVLLQTPTLNVFEANLNTFLAKKDKKRD